MQPEELSDGKFININEEVVGIKRMRCPRGSDTGKNFPLEELSDILHTERGKNTMLETDLNTQRMTNRKDAYPKFMMRR